MVLLHRAQGFLDREQFLGHGDFDFRIVEEAAGSGQVRHRRLHAFVQRLSERVGNLVLGKPGQRRQGRAGAVGLRFQEIEQRRVRRTGDGDGESEEQREKSHGRTVATNGGEVKASVEPFAP